ncbi:MAG: DarT ssDNA thymidine ADP-ribosyltransferase family protein [Alistipes communis]
MKKYKDAISWDDFNKRLGVDVATEMLQEFANRLNWRFVSQSQKIKFTEELVRKYEDKWFWPELMRNIKFQEDIPDFENIFANHRSIVTFTDRIKWYRSNPCIYHFTHFYNAIDVIRSRKILSRDRAEELGLLKYDSAGSVVFRSSKAHKFARFYFRPCTPTQYYNEALGADSQLGYYNWRGEWKSKYPKAVGLGLPKCPVPVFFKFDMDEVLAKMPEQCYYSDRNMQSDNPNVYKIIDRPEALGIEYLYSTMEDAYRAAKPNRYSRYNREVHLNEMSKVMRYSQQEFLVMSEFDFSEIKSLQIICYDNSYARLLKQIFVDDPISEKIVEYGDERFFERENRRLNLSSSEDNVRLSTDFEDEYYFNITSEKMSEVEFDLSACEVIYDTTNELRLKGTIAWKKTDIPFNIFFVDPKARTKEWLVYQNI